MRFGAIANSARGGPQRPPPMGDRVNMIFDVKNANIADFLLWAIWPPPYD